MVMTSTEKTYNKIISLYVKKVKSDTLDHPYIERFLSYLKSGQQVLDIGAGAGSLADEMIKLHKLKVTAIDVSAKMVSFGRKKYPSLSHHKMDMRKMKFQKNKFDALFSNYSLIHVPEEEIPQTLKEYSRVLKPKGYLYLALQSPAKKTDKDGYYPVIYKKGVSLFINVMRKEEIGANLQRAGFKIINIETRKPDKKTEFPFNKLFIIAQKR